MKLVFPLVAALAITGCGGSAHGSAPKHTKPARVAAAPTRAEQQAALRRIVAQYTEAAGTAFDGLQRAQKIAEAGFTVGDANATAASLSAQRVVARTPATVRAIRAISTDGLLPADAAATRTYLDGKAEMYRIKGLEAREIIAYIDNPSAASHVARYKALGAREDAVYRRATKAMRPVFSRLDVPWPKTW